MASLVIIIIILVLVLYFNNISRKEKEQVYQKEMMKMERENTSLLHASEDDRKFKLGLKNIDDKVDNLTTKIVIYKKNKSITELIRSKEYQDMQDELDKLLKEKEEVSNRYFQNRIKN